MPGLRHLLRNAHPKQREGQPRRGAGAIADARSHSLTQSINFLDNSSPRRLA
jgi:hypothetical protein